MNAPSCVNSQLGCVNPHGANLHPATAHRRRDLFASMRKRGVRCITAYSRYTHLPVLVHPTHLRTDAENRRTSNERHSTSCQSSPPGPAHRASSVTRSSHAFLTASAELRWPQHSHLATGLLLTVLQPMGMPPPSPPSSPSRSSGSDSSPPPTRAPLGRGAPAAVPPLAARARHGASRAVDPLTDVPQGPHSRGVGTKGPEPWAWAKAHPGLRGFLSS